MPPPDRPSRAGLAVAWLGGAAFVAALAAYVHFFAVRLAAPGPDGVAVPAALAWNAALFTVFALHHSLMARAPAKAWLTRAVPAAYERTVYVWIASALLILVTLAVASGAGSGLRRAGAAVVVVPRPPGGGRRAHRGGRARAERHRPGGHPPGGAPAADDRRARRLALHRRPPPDLPGLGAHRAGGADDDRRSAVVGGAQHRLPGHRHTLGGA